MILKARYVIPVVGPVIEDGAVLIERGKVAAVKRAQELRSAPVTDYGDAVICPGLVNAHTHLELSLLAGRIAPSGDFIDWLERLNAVGHLRDGECERVGEAMRLGIEQSVAAGVTAVGDITRRPDWTRRALAESKLLGVSFGEVIAIGTRRHLLNERLEAAVSTNWQTERIRSGVSPHSPYAVEPEGIRACARRAREVHARLCIHVAESVDEDAFVRSGRGPLAEFLRRLGVWDRSIPVGGCSPIELVHSTGLLGRETILAHANYLAGQDVELIAKSGASVAYCPRTHGAFQHPPHPFRELLAAGVNVCLGTDSLASNPSLSILDELRFLRRACPDLPAKELVAMGTIRGARALGIEDKTGSITVGKRADLVVIPLDQQDVRSGWGAFLESTRCPQAVYVAGELCFAE